MLSTLPISDWTIAEWGYDADWFRDALKNKGIYACILGRKSRGRAIRYDKRCYERRSRIDIMFAKLRDLLKVPDAVPLSHRSSGLRTLLAMKINESGT